MRGNSEIKISLITGMAALSIRLLHLVFTTRLNPLSQEPVLDAAIYHEWAKAIISGGDPVPTRLMQAPLYPWLIAVIYRITGPDPISVHFVQAISGAISCMLIVIVSRRIFKSTAAAIIAGITAAIYLPFIFYEGIMVPATIIILLNLIFIILLVPTGKRLSIPRLLIAGIILGISTMAKPVALLLLPFAVIHILLTGESSSCGVDREPRGGNYSGSRSETTVDSANTTITGEISAKAPVLTCILPLFAGVIIGVSPLTVRNAIIAGDFIPFTTGGGINFYIGNNPAASGYYNVPTYRGTPLGGTPSVQWRKMHELARKERGEKLSAREVSSFWLENGIRYDLRHPGKWFDLLWKKFTFFWNRYERANVESFSFHRRFPGVLGLPLMIFGIVAPLGILGIFLTRNRWRNLWILYGGVITYLTVALAFYVLARYRLPVVPFLIPFSGAAVTGIVSLAREKRFSELFLIVAALLLLFFFSNITVAKDTNRGISNNLNRLGKLYLQEGDTTRAISSFSEALRLSPENSEAGSRLKELREKNN